MPAIVAFAALIVLAVAVLLPIGLTALNGFKALGELQTHPFGLPRVWMWSNYWDILNSLRYWQVLGNSLLIAALTVFIDQREAFHSTILAAGATLSNLNIRGFTGTTSQLAHLIDVQSIVISYADATYLVGILCVLCLPLVLLLRRRRTA